MSDGAFTGEPLPQGNAEATGPGTAGGGPPGTMSSGWGDPAPEKTTERADATPRGGEARRLLGFAVILLVIGLPLVVGALAFLSPAPPVSETTETATSKAESTTPPSGADVAAATAPGWTRPAWADSVAGLTAYELPARSDVAFAGGRLRPTLGVTCAGGRTEVHIVTGGTAIVDPSTSGPVVRLTFDETPEQAQQWVAADDLRALFAPDPVTIASRIRDSKRLSFGYGHYLTGPTVVEFDLRGAETVLDTVVTRCGSGRSN